MRYTIFAVAAILEISAYLTDWELVKGCWSVCAEDFEEYQRNCYDPNKDTIVNPLKCGLTELPTKQSPCHNRKLPECPYLHEGLWGMDLYSVRDYSYSRYVHNRFCSKQMDYSLQSLRPITQEQIGIDGIPGVRLTEGNYMKCHSDTFGNMDMARGFTLSMMVRVNEYSKRENSVFFSYGLLGSKGAPNFLFERQYWGRKDLKFSASVLGKEYRTTRIPASAFNQKWAHLVLTWHPTSGHFVYINGRKFGFRYSYSSRRSKSLPDYGRFLIGRSTRTSNRRQGYLDAYVSSLALWNQRMVDDQVTEIYHFYEDLIDKSNKGIEPTLPTQMMRFLAQPIRGNLKPSCFETPMTLSEMQDAGTDGPECYPYY